jgi:hypothetical protein
MTAIYQALKSIGFRETYWQFIYPGQIGGLIRNPRNTLIEFHVRFLKEGMIYAEIELGRSVLLHFANRKLYINQYLICKMGSRLSAAHREYLRGSIKRHKSVYAKDWPEWTVENRFVTPSMKKQIRFLAVLADWRTLALIMLASVVSSLADGPTVLPLITALMIFVYVLAPKRYQ